MSLSSSGVTTFLLVFPSALLVAWLLMDLTGVPPVLFVPLPFRRLSSEPDLSPFLSKREPPVLLLLTQPLLLLLMVLEPELLPVALLPMLRPPPRPLPAPVLTTPCMLSVEVSESEGVTPESVSLESSESE